MALKWPKQCKNHVNYSKMETFWVKWHKNMDWLYEYQEECQKFSIIFSIIQLAQSLHWCLKTLFNHLKSFKMISCHVLPPYFSSHNVIFSLAPHNPNNQVDNTVNKELFILMYCIVLFLTTFLWPSTTDNFSHLKLFSFTFAYS